MREHINFLHLCRAPSKKKKNSEKSRERTWHGLFYFLFQGYLMQTCLRVFKIIELKSIF